MNILNSIVNTLSQTTTTYAASDTSSSGSNNNLFLLLLILIPIIIIVVMVMRKRKKSDGVSRYEGRAVKDEVWRTLKRFLKDNGEVGQEIIDSYVVKVPNPYDKSKMTPQQKVDFEAQQARLKELKKTDKAAYKIEHKAYKKALSRVPEEYMIWFISRDTKSGAVADPRIILCRIEYKRTDRKNRERMINIIGLQEYDKQMEWIKPIKDKDDRLFEKQQQARDKALAKKQAKEAKKNKKEPVTENEFSDIIVKSTDVVTTDTNVA